MDAFLDTGNELTDPISGCPVIVVEFERIQSILPYEIQKIYLQGREEQLEYITRVMSESTWINRFCIVPYSTLDNSGSILPAFRGQCAHKVRGRLAGSRRNTDWHTQP